MLGRKNYTREEVDACRTAIGEQLTAYRELRKHATADPAATAALDAFEPLFFNNLALALDRRFVHRLRVVAGKDGNALNELEMICDSLMNNDGLFGNSSVIKYVPDRSVVKLSAGDRVRLSEAEFERLFDAFLAEIERKFR